MYAYCLHLFSLQTDVQTAVSLTSPGNVQIVLQSETGSKSTKLAHIIKADIDAGGTYFYHYSIRKNQFYFKNA